MRAVLLLAVASVALVVVGPAGGVSTVNPYVMNTALARHPNPIYTQPVNNQGLSDTDPIFNSVVTAIRQLLANGQPTGRIGDTDAQILSMSNPDENVAVASPSEPFASQGANALIEPQIIAENALSAVPFARESGAR
jgi:hypothetical protein